jgi:N-methylhydantoinase B
MKQELLTGEATSLETHGGGGYGNPFQRDPARVLEDVRDGYVSIDAAQRDYGVRIDAANWKVDSKATRLTRGRARKRGGQ